MLSVCSFCIGISDDKGMMNEQSTSLQNFWECDILYAHFHKAVCVLVHTVLYNAVSQFFSSFCHIQYFSLCESFQFLIVNICTIHGNYVSLAQCWRPQHKRIVGDCRYKLNIWRDSRIGVYDPCAPLCPLSFCQSWDDDPHPWTTDWRIVW